MRLDSDPFKQSPVRRQAKKLRSLVSAIVKTSKKLPKIAIREVPKSFLELIDLELDAIYFDSVEGYTAKLNEPVYGVRLQLVKHLDLYMSGIPPFDTLNPTLCETGAEYLSTASNLEALNFRNVTYEGENPYTLINTIPNVLIWRNLRDLTLHSITIHESVLVGILRNHSSSVKILTLDSVWLDQREACD
jgi:hypothetical protein